MARAQADINSPYTFVRGLITEANRLSEDLNLMTDGENIALRRDGSCVRRKGIDTEFGGNTVSGTRQVIPNNHVVKAVTWKNVNGDPSKNICVVQAGTSLHFFDMSYVPLSDGFIDTVDMSQFSINTTNVASEPISATPTTLALLIVNKYCEPIWVIYDDETQELEVSNLILKIRDFGGLPDGLKIAEKPTTLSAAHQYNLLNQGWADTALSTAPDLTGDGTSTGGSGTTGGGTSVDSGDPKDRFSSGGL